MHLILISLKKDLSSNFLMKIRSAKFNTLYENFSTLDQLLNIMKSNTLALNL